MRKDCVVFLSPINITSGDIIIGNGSDAINQLIAYRNELPSSSYAVMDSGYKYQYDRYNDTYRWVPLNGDVAGLCARTDYTNDAWWSPGGLNRGQIKNVVKLAVNPGKTERDNMYKSGINPVVTFLVKVQFSSVIKHCLLNQVHLIELTFVDCSSFLKSYCNCCSLSVI